MGGRGAEGPQEVEGGGGGGGGGAHGEEEEPVTRRGRGSHAP